MIAFLIPNCFNSIFFLLIKILAGTTTAAEATTAEGGSTAAGETTAVGATTVAGASTVSGIRIYIVQIFLWIHNNEQYLHILLVMITKK